MYDVLAVIPFIGVIIFGFIAAGIRKYVERRYSNLATKTDIEEMTRLEQNVKAEFNRNLATLNAELSLLSSQQSSWASEERAAIFNYLDAFFEWVSRLESFYFETFDDATINNFKREVMSAKLKCQIAEGRLMVFMTHNNDFISIKNQLGLYAYEIEEVVFDRLEKLSMVDNAIERYIEKFKDEVKKEVVADWIQMKEDWDQEGKNQLEYKRKKYDGALTTFLQFSNDYLKSVIDKKKAN